jgi:hypothetical protein
VVRLPISAQAVSVVARTSVACSLALLAASFALDHGYWVARAGLRGPFRQERPDGKAYVIPLRPEGLSRTFFDASSDSDDWPPTESPLRVFLNGRRLEDRVASRHEVRRSGAGRFCYFGRSLVFSLPSGVPNDASSHVGVEHRLHLKPNWRAGLWILAALAGGLLVASSWRPPRSSLSLAVALTQTLGWLLRAVLVGVALVAGVFLGACLTGLVQHYALPPAAVLLSTPSLGILAKQEMSLPYLVLAFGLLGAVLAWLSSVHPALLEVQREQERALVRLWHWSAPLIIIAAYLLCAAGPWTGLLRAGDFGAVAIGGVVPWGDGAGHFSGSLLQVMKGTFDSWVERRLVAAATRSALALAVSYSATGFLLLQVVLVGLATCVSTWTVTRWRGVWSGIVYFGLVYALVRPSLATFMTEPLGYLWSLAAIPFVVLALRRSSITHGSTAMLLMGLALLTRMGSMLTAPAIGLWMVWAARRSRRGAVAAASLTLLVLAACGGLVWTLSWLYGSGTGMPGSNIAYSLCGVAHGGNYGDCESLYAAELANKTEADRARILYRKAWEATVRQPRRALARLIEGERYYLANVLDRAVLGHFGLPAPRWFPIRLWELVAVAGIGWTLLHRRERGEPTFWLLMALAPMCAAPFMIFDDGWRALTSIGPLVALLLASGFATPATGPAPITDRAPSSASRALLCLGATLALLVAAPGVAHRLDFLKSRTFKHVPLAPDEVWILGGKTMAGLLVVPDALGLPLTVPSVHYSDFVREVTDDELESYGRILYPELRTREFGFVASVGSIAYTILITPPEVMREQQVNGWKLRIANRGEGYYFWLCDKAEPISMSGAP